MADDERGQRLLAMISKLLSHNVVSIEQPMLERIGFLIEQQKPTLAIAEHVTKGYLSSWLQDDARIEQQCGATWVLGEQTHSPVDREEEQLGATLALAGATRTNCNTDIAIATGKLEQSTFSLAISTPRGEWGQTLTLQRDYDSKNTKHVISVVAADMLRRYLAGLPMFVEYGFFARKDQIFLPSDTLTHNA